MSAYYKLIRILLVYLIHILTYNLSQASKELIIETKLGKIRGIQTKRAQTFYGIPYAQPPVGNLRWENPVEPNPWTTIYDATKRKPGCSQAECDRVLPPLVCPKTGKDCLFLNIWTPLMANSSTSYPVLAFIHGGNFDGMSASSVLFDGENITYKGEIIVVTLDYRLGALGFLVTRDKIGQKGAKGNYGLLDQRLALKWIHDNIKSFGGDPNQVTVSGQSAGSQSIAIHMMSKDGSQFFHRAIMESNPLSLPFRSHTEALYIGDLVAKRLGCRSGDLGCLRKISADQISQATEDVRSEPSSLKLLEFFEPWGPYVDGRIVPYQPLEAIQNGAYVDMPIIMGSLTEETRIYVYSAWSKPLSTLDYELAMAATFPTQIKNVLKRYPPSTARTDQRDTLVEAATDFVFTCCTRNFTRNVVDQKHSPVFRYVFDHAFSFPGWGNFTYCNGHVCHGTELPYVFQSVSLGNFTITADEYKLSDSLIYYWSNFVKTGDPNKGHPVLLNWPKFQNTTDWQYLLFQTPQNSIGSTYREEFCDFWDQIGYKA